MTNSCIKWKTVKTMSWMLVVTIALVLGSTAQVAAQGKATSAKGGYETTMVPAMVPEDEGFVDFVHGALKIRGKGGRVKFDLRGVELAEGTEGVLCVKFAVNGMEDYLKFSFVVEAEDNENRVKMRARLTDAEAFPLEVSGVVNILGAEAILAESCPAVDDGMEEVIDESVGEDTNQGMDEGASSVKAQVIADVVIATPGFIFAAKPERDDDSDDLESSDRDNPRGPDVNGRSGENRGKDKDGDGTEGVETDDETDDGTDDETDDGTDDETDDGTDDGTDDETDDGTDDGTDDETDDETNS